MLANNRDVFNKVTNKLAEMAAPQNRVRPIAEETEVFRDLGIYGDEIVELFWWLEREFGLKPTVDPFEFAPHEFPFFGVLQAIKKVVGTVPQYKSLRVRDILDAIESNRWPEGHT